MQKLKRLPLLRRLAGTVGRLRDSVLNLLERLDLSRNWLMTAVLIVTLILLLCGCSPRTVKPDLPAQADARAVPEFDGQTYRDVLLYLIELREMAYSCEIDKASIREVYGE